MKAIVCAAVLGLGIAGPTMAQTQVSWYAETDNGHGCRYPTEKSWLARETYESATVDRRHGRIVAIHINETDESGDWTANETYSVSNGLLVVLQRRYGTFYDGEVALEENWRRDSDHWLRTRRQLTDLSGDHVLKDNPEVVYPSKKVDRLEDFGFAKLMSDEVKTKTCL